MNILSYMYYIYKLQIDVHIHVYGILFFYIYNIQSITLNKLKYVFNMFFTLTVLCTRRGPNCIAAPSSH